MKNGHRLTQGTRGGNRKRLPNTIEELSRKRAPELNLEEVQMGQVRKADISRRWACRQRHGSKGHIVVWGLGELIPREDCGECGRRRQAWGESQSVGPEQRRQQEGRAALFPSFNLFLTCNEKVISNTDSQPTFYDG